VGPYTAVGGCLCSSLLERFSRSKRISPRKTISPIPLARAIRLTHETWLLSIASDEASAMTGTMTNLSMGVLDD
jgi:hypothetical protein